MRIICIADPAGKHAQLQVPVGDILIIAGSVTASGFSAEVADFAAWLATLPHPCKVVVPGGRDFAVQQDPARARSLLQGAHCLIGDSIQYDDLSLCGTPYHQRDADGSQDAFAADAEAAEMHWGLIMPCDILVSARPPRGVLDELPSGVLIGCPVAAEAVERIRPRLHVFGGEGCAPGARFVDGHVFACPGSDPMVLNLHSSEEAALMALEA